MSDLLENPLLDNFLFYPRAAKAGSSRLPDVVDGTIPAGDGVALGYRLYLSAPGQPGGSISDFQVSLPGQPGGSISDFQVSRPGKPVIVYFHGNGEVAADHDDVAPLYRQAGASLLVFDYRGYGWSTGKPAAITLLPDAEAIYRALPGILEANGLDGGPRLLMGRSLGSASAVHLASLYSAAWRGLIVESGFARVLPLVARLGLPMTGPAGHDPIGNLDKVSQLDLPLLVMHGERDMLIPVSEAQALFDASPARIKVIKRFPGAGHNDLMTYAEEYFEAIRDFLVTSLR